MRVSIPWLALLLCGCARACGLEGEYVLDGAGGAGGAGNASRSPIAHYPLDEADGVVARDVASALDGTLHGGTTWRPDGGKIGGALELDGLMGHVQLGTHDAFDFGAGDFSITLWLRFPSMDNLSDWVLVQHGNVNEAYYKMGLSYQRANGRRVTFDLDDGMTELSTPLVCKFYFDDQLEQWFLFAVVRTEGDLSLYVNGLLWSRTTIPPIDVSTTHETTLGMSPGNLLPFPGRLDDVRFYDVALTADEVAELYEAVEPPWQLPSCAE